MIKPGIPKKPNHTGWLWWLALAIAAIAGGICYLLSRDTINPDMGQQFRLVIMFAVIGAGICIIAATSRWWLNH